MGAGFLFSTAGQAPRHARQAAQHAPEVQIYARGASVPPSDTAAPTPTSAPAPVDVDPRALRQPSHADLPPLPPEGLGPGSRGPVVAAYEQRMADVKLDPGPIDGNYTQETIYAVETVQRIMGAPVNGRIGPGEKAFLEDFRYLAPLHGNREPNRTEIDVHRQLLTLYDGYQVRLVTLTSTGTGLPYCYETPKDHPIFRICAIANTPSGRFTYYSRYPGMQDGDNGPMYNPVYFNGGIAVHGTVYGVSLQPQTLGCAVIPMHIAEYFPRLVENGDAVYVDGGRPAPVLSRTAVSDAAAAALPPGDVTNTAPPSTTAPTTTTTSTTTTTTTVPPTTTTDPPTTTTSVP